MRPGSSGRLLGALAALLLALGLPWGVVGDQTAYIPGWTVPGSCSVDYDGYLWCLPGFTSPGFVVPGPGAPITGYMTSARVFLVAAVLVIGYALARGAEPRLDWAIGLTVAAVLLSGTALRTGALTALLAVVLLMLERRARRAGEPRSEAAQGPARGGT